MAKIVHVINPQILEHIYMTKRSHEKTKGDKKDLIKYSDGYIRNIYQTTCMM